MTITGLLIFRDSVDFLQNRAKIGQKIPPICPIKIDAPTSRMTVDFQKSPGTDDFLKNLSKVGCPTSQRKTGLLKNPLRFCCLIDLLTNSLTLSKPIFLVPFLRKSLTHRSKMTPDAHIYCAFLDACKMKGKSILSSSF